jgi:hypothetical protein
VSLGIWVPMGDTHCVEAHHHHRERSLEINVHFTEGRDVALWSRLLYGHRRIWQRQLVGNVYRSILQRRDWTWSECITRKAGVTDCILGGRACNDRSGERAVCAPTCEQMHALKAEIERLRAALKQIEEGPYEDNDDSLAWCQNAASIALMEDR